MKHFKTYTEFWVSLEGQDASGKSELLWRIDHDLKTKGFRTKVVEEFSKVESWRIVL